MQDDKRDRALIALMSVAELLCADIEDDATRNDAMREMYERAVVAYHLEDGHVALPPLTADERAECFDEAFLFVSRRDGIPLDEESRAQRDFELELDLVFRHLQLAAREAKASPAVKSAVLHRRMMLRFGLMPAPVHNPGRMRTGR